MNEFVPACRLSEVPRPGARRVVVDGRPIAVVHADEGVFALEDRCSHADVALSEGEVIDCTIECWLHGSAFDLRTGIPLSPPAVAPVAVYDVRLDDDADPMILISTTPRDPRSPNSTDEGALR